MICLDIRLIGTHYFSQISSLQYPVTGAKGTFVPRRGWFIFGGNAAYNQTQQLQTMDGTWTTDNPIFQHDYPNCIVQVSIIDLAVIPVVNHGNYNHEMVK